MFMNPLTAIDFYKADHRRQYPAGTTKVYSNFTPRSGKLTNLPADNDGHVVFFGLQYFIKDFLLDTFNSLFFQMPREAALALYQRRMDSSLGKDTISLEHIAALHDLGYLPIEIKALAEGAIVPYGVPMLTIQNTHPDFFWLTNYLETILSVYLWKACTSATTARYYRQLLAKYAEKTGADKSFVDFQAHDFSFRGMSSLQDAIQSGMAHLLFFKGTDTVAAIDNLEVYYNANAEKEFIAGSVPATEHSVMCMGSKDGELETFKRLLALYPAGIVSVVSDTWDFWNVLTSILPQLKDEIEARDGKLVIRPDSGDPEAVICGNLLAHEDSLEPSDLGALRVLWDNFGGTVNEKGYKVLNPKIGLIYGDSITPERASTILSRMEQIGFCSSNIVFGVGSYTYQHVTRDTHGFAVKSTYGEINGEPVEIFKDPVTDTGKLKKSAKGLLKVVADGKSYKLLDQQEDDGSPSSLTTVLKDGKLEWDYSLAGIRDLVARSL